MPPPINKKPNDFTPVIGAINLADYVITITDNINKFPDCIAKEKKMPDGSIAQIYIQRQDSLTNWAREQAKQIFMLAYTANMINVQRQPGRREERLKRQLKAIALCEEHLAAIQLCRKHFKLSSGKVKHWGGMTLAVKAAIEGWHESDKRRYRAP